MLEEEMNQKYGLVIIDMQPDCLGYVWKTSRQILIDAQSNILDVCIKKDIPVAVFEYSVYEPTIKELKEKIDQCKHSEPFLKNCWNGFNSCPDAAYFFSAKDVTDLCFAGVYASQCVEATAKGALDLGFEVLTAEDLIANTCSPISLLQTRLTERWFRRNGRFFENHREIIGLLK